MSVNVIVNQMAVIFILMLLGYVLHRKDVLTKEGNRVLSNIIILVLNPAMMISGALSKERAGSMGDVVLSLALGFAVYGVLILLGYLVPIVLRTNVDERNSYNMMTIFGNIGFIGIPVCAAVFGTGSLIFVTMFNLPYNILIYTYGIYLMNKGELEREKFQVKSIFNAGTISGIVAILIFALQIQLPSVLSDTVDYLANATTALSMLVLGVSVAQIPFKEIFTTVRLYLFCILRMVLLPVLMSFVLKPFIANETVLGVTILLMAMPIGSMPVILAQKYGKDSSLATRGVVLSTLLSIITIPLVVYLISF